MSESGFSVAQLRYVTDDATLPQGSGARVIAHVCNNRGGYGAGFALAVAKRYPRAKTKYQQGIRNLRLGDVQLVNVTSGLMDDGLWVANMIAQDGYATDARPCALRYDDLAECLKALANFSTEPFSVHCPRMGAEIAGGDWAAVAHLLVKHLVMQGISVTVYDLEKK